MIQLSWYNDGQARPKSWYMMKSKSHPVTELGKESTLLLDVLMEMGRQFTSTVTFSHFRYCSRQQKLDLI